MGLVVYFHGLESTVGGSKYKFLKDRYGDVYAPSINYRQSNIFNSLYEQLINQKIDLIAGSSMGGYFAYWMSKKINAKNTLLFNPALPYRTSIEPEVDKSGKYKPYHIVILGKEDDIIKPADTFEWLSNNEKKFSVFTENYGHRTPFSSFKKYFNQFG